MKTIESGNKEFYISPEGKTIIGTMRRKKGSTYKDFSEIDDVTQSIIRYATDQDGSVNVYSAAVCKDPDEYNEKIGMDICASKLELKNHIWIANKYKAAHKRLQKAANRASELYYKHLNKALAIKTDLEEYYGGEIK